MESSRSGSPSMDGRTLHDLGGIAMRREGQHGRGGEPGNSNFLRVTPASRRVSTTNPPVASRLSRNEQEECLGHDETFEDAALSTSDSLPPVNSSWDEEDDAEGAGGSPPRDARKIAEATTPTLIDEVDFADDEEQEIVSLDQERLRQKSRAFFGKDDFHLRRTPGAQMYKSNFDQQSMRRTPGPSQMHHSAPLTASQQEPASGDAPALGFGLTLSTPVATSSRAKPLNLSTAWEGSSQHSSADAPKATDINQMKPPRAPGSTTRDQHGAFVAPWALSRSSPLEARHGVYSPNTLRLTEDLGNLLLEDEDGVDQTSRGAPHVFGDQGASGAVQKATSDIKQDGSEGWTAPFVISMDGPSRVPRSSSGRNRRRADGGRRSRGFERSSGGGQMEQQQGVAKTGGFLPNAQKPKPLRNVRHNFGGTEGHNSGNYGPDTEGVGPPRLLNFSGALGHDGTFFRPVPSATPPHPNFNQSSGDGVQSAFHPGNIAFGAQAFQNPFQQGQPFASHPAKFPPQFPAQNTVFASNPPMNQNPNFNFAPQNVGYHIQGIHPVPQEFMQNIPVHHHSQPPVPQFPPHAWSQPMPMQYDGIQMEQGNWHGPHGGWQMGDYGYAMSQRVRDSAMPMPPAQNWTPPEREHGSAEMQMDPFSMLQQPGTQPLVLPPEQVNRNSSRVRNPKKSSSRSRNQSKNDRTQKAVTSNQVSAGKKTTSVTTKNKKKYGKDTKIQNKDVQNAIDDPVDSKRTGLFESPATRTAFKEFYRKFRVEERTSFQDAENFAMQALSDGSLPESIHWRVYLELADLSKRANKFVEARNLYQQVCHLQPHASQGWLEFSKLEEECGNMNICAKILRAGLEYCPHSENLLTRAIKHEEKRENLVRARELLSRLKHVGIEKVWRTVLEGALLEARAGNDVISRRVFKYLMHHVPWYGPLYLEAYRLERDLGRSKEALTVVERGLQAIPRYGPLWFGAFRLCEELDMEQRAYHLPQSMSMIDRAASSISKELVWKVHLEAAQMLERVSVECLDATTDPCAQQIMDLCRKRFAMTILTCPPNLRWKVWLASGRMELSAGNSDTSRRLFLRAHQVVPEKGRAAALLECARLEEFVGDTDLARAILCKSRGGIGSDWKVWLESILLEIRCKNPSRAIELAKLALKLHSGTGRVWASLIQLRQFEEGEEAQFDTLKLALNAVPKSGEVWCEGARIHLNPFARSFDLPQARRHLFFATKFTPQYGDGFLETLRLEILEQWLLPIAASFWDATKDRLSLTDTNTREEALVNYVDWTFRALYAAYKREVEGESTRANILDEGIVNCLREKLGFEFCNEVLDVSHLQLRCANADPNYGSLWFHIRAGATDTARRVLSRATDVMLIELSRHSYIYLSAFVRRFAILACLQHDHEQKPKEGESDTDVMAETTAEYEDLIGEAFLSTPSLEEIIALGGDKHTEETGMGLLEGTMTRSDFSSGLVALSRQEPLKEMSLHERRKALFGIDSLLS